MSTVATPVRWTGVEGLRPPPRAPGPSGTRLTWWRPACGIGLCALAGAALRAPFLSAGLLPDEGGYAYVAQRWSRGARLYDDAWADRPQGLLIAFRLLLNIAEEPWAIRLGAVICGAGITVLLGVIGWQLRGPATGVAAAAIYAIVGVGPRFNGFTFNGELAAALPATAAIAAALAWRSSLRLRWLVVAGLAAGSAVLMKQSGFDGLVVAVVIVMLATKSWTTRRRPFAVLVGSTAVPAAASVIHGWIVGWNNYWFAVAGYRFHSSSGRLDPVGLVERAGRFFTTVDDALRDLGPLVLFALAALVLGRLRGEPIAIAAAWIGTAMIGFNLGALYWRHYYVQLVPPLTLLAALAVTTLARRVDRAVAVTFAILPVSLGLIELALTAPERREHLIAHQRQFEDHELLATQLRQRSDPDDTVYVLVSEPDLYFLVDRPSRYPYIWGHPVEEIPGALQRLRALLSSPDRPEWLVVYTPPHEVDSSGRLETIIGRHYQRDRGIESRQARLFRERDDAAQPPG